MRDGDRRLARPGAGCPRHGRRPSAWRPRRHRHWRRGGAPDGGEPLDAAARPDRRPGWTRSSTGRRAVVVASPPIVRALVVHALGRAGARVLAARRRRPVGQRPDPGRARLAGALDQRSLRAGATRHDVRLPSTRLSGTPVRIRGCPATVTGEQTSRTPRPRRVGRRGRATIREPGHRQALTPRGWRMRWPRPR